MIILFFTLFMNVVAIALIIGSLIERIDTNRELIKYNSQSIRGITKILIERNK